MRWNHHVHENIFFTKNICSRILKPLSYCTYLICKMNWTGNCSIQKILHNFYFIIFTPPPSNEMWSDFFPIFSKNIHMYLNIRYSLLVPYRQQLQETRVPKCQLTSLITSIFLPLIHRCPPLDECFNPLAVPKLCEEKEKKTQLNFYHFGR